METEYGYYLRRKLTNPEEELYPFIRQLTDILSENEDTSAQQKIALLLNFVHDYLPSHLNLLREKFEIPEKVIQRLPDIMQIPILRAQYPQLLQHLQREGIILRRRQQKGKTRGELQKFHETAPTLTQTEVARELGVSRPNISYHERRLRNEGFTVPNRIRGGRQTAYGVDRRIKPPVL